MHSDILNRSADSHYIIKNRFLRIRQESFRSTGILYQEMFPCPASFVHNAQSSHNE